MIGYDKPDYQRWCERDFLADIDVARYMTWLQRLLYRALLQAAFYCETRPDLPNDDEKLWKLADCRDRKMWEENKACILGKFQIITLENGSEVLRQKRLKLEWDWLQGWRAKSRSGGLVSGISRTKSKHCSTIQNEPPLNQIEPPLKQYSRSKSMSIKSRRPSSADCFAFSGENLKVKTVLDEKLRAEFPGFDFAGEYPKMEKWLTENQDKPCKNVASFVRRWLTNNLAKSAESKPAESRPVKFGIQPVSEEGKKLEETYH